jgi:hypothetical protein
MAVRESEHHVNVPGTLTIQKAAVCSAFARMDTAAAEGEHIFRVPGTLRFGGVA